MNNKLILKRIWLGSYIITHCFVGLLIGLAVAFYFTVEPYIFPGLSVPMNVSHTLKGVGLVVALFIMAGFVESLITYLPFQFLITKLNIFDLEGDFEIFGSDSHNSMGLERTMNYIECLIRFIPGFKTRKPWKMILAAIFYIILLLAFFLPPHTVDRISIGVILLLAIVIIGIIRIKLENSNFVVKIFAYIGVVFVILLLLEIPQVFQQHAVKAVINDTSNMILTQEKIGEEKVIIEQERVAINLLNEMMKAFNEKDVFLYDYRSDDNNVNNINTCMESFTLAKIGGNWMLVEADKYLKETQHSLKRFDTYFKLLNKAKEKYGTDDLTNWT